MLMKQKLVIAGLIILIALWGTNNFIKMRRYEQLVSARIGMILTVITPGNLMDIAQKGEITKEEANTLEQAYSIFCSNIYELIHIGTHLKHSPPDREMLLKQTALNIYHFFVQISNEIDNEDMAKLKLDDSRIQKLEILHDLNIELKKIATTFRNAYHDKLIDAKRKHWIEMLYEIGAVIVEIEGFH